MDKRCQCGVTIRVYETHCKDCLKHQVRICRSCGQEFQPPSNYRRLCDACVAPLFKKDRFKPMHTDNPCEKCRFLRRCKVLVRQIDGWPVCWAQSPDRDEFIRAYGNENTYLGGIARGLIASLERWDYERTTGV